MDQDPATKPEVGTPSRSATIASIISYSVQSGDEDPALEELRKHRDDLYGALRLRKVELLGRNATADQEKAIEIEAANKAESWFAREQQRLRDRIARQRKRDEGRVVGSRDRPPRPPRDTRPPRKSEPPTQAEAEVIVSEVRAEVHRAIEATAMALSEDADEMIAQDPWIHLRVGVPLTETLEIATDGISTTLEGSGASLATGTEWGSVRKLWALRPGVIRIEFQAWPSETSERTMRNEFARAINGVVGAEVVSTPIASDESQLRGDLIRDWLRANGVQITAPDETARLQQQVHGALALEYLRGSLVYVGALARRLEGVEHALDRVANSHNYARADIELAKPADLDTVLNAIRKRCEEELRASLENAHRELANRVDQLHVALESKVHARRTLLVASKTKERRNGGSVPAGFEIFEIDPEAVGLLASGISGTPALEGLKSLSEATEHVGSEIVRVCDSRLRDNIVGETLSYTQLISSRSSEAWRRIEAEKFFEPVSRAATAGLIRTHVDRFRNLSKVFIPESEIPEKVRLRDVILKGRFVEAYKFIMQRYAGIFMMVLIIFGLSVPSLIKKFFQNQNGGLSSGQMFMSILVFIVLLSGIAYSVLRSNRREALSIAEVRMRESLLKLQRKALDDFIGEWTKMVDRNAMEGLNDFMRRLRSDLDSAAHRQVSAWQRRVDALSTERAKLVARNKQLDQTRKILDVTSKTVRQALVKLAKHMFKAAAG
jgi:hypothetical protein